MRRRQDPASATPADGVFWWREYPPLDAPDGEHEAWSERFHAWCDEHGVDAIAVTVEATRLGLTDRPWNPYAEGAL